MVDGDGGIVEADAGAEEVLRRWFGPRSAAGRLPAELAGWFEVSRSAVRAPRFVRTRSDRRLEVKLASGPAMQPMTAPAGGVTGRASISSGGAVEAACRSCAAGEVSRWLGRDARKLDLEAAVGPRADEPRGTHGGAGDLEPPGQLGRQTFRPPSAGRTSAAAPPRHRRPPRRSRRPRRP